MYGWWKQLDFDTWCQYSSLCRLQASLMHSAAGMQHTACGILPNEQIEVRLHRKRNGYDCFIASGNTRFANKVCELLDPKLRQIVKGTTLRRPLRYNWILTASVNISTTCALKASFQIFGREMRTRFANKVCELLQVQCCFHQKNPRSEERGFWWKQLDSNQ